MFWFIILLVIIAAIGYVFLNAYNSLQRKAQEIRESLSNISVTMSKKVSLINQLMDVVKNYQESEQLTHLSVVKETGVNAIYSSYKNANTMMTNLQGMAERYPELKSDQQYHRLISNIENIEQEVSSCRKLYNSKVKDYNTTRSSIPTIFVANALGFSNAPYLDFTIEEETLLKEFKTDDGERLNALLNTAKNNIKGSSKTLAISSKDAINKATIAGKKIIKSDQARDLSFFYMLPESTPKGPVSYEDLNILAEDTNWIESVKINQAETEEWLAYADWHSKYNTADQVITIVPERENVVADNEEVNNNLADLASKENTAITAVNDDVEGAEAEEVGSQADISEILNETAAPINNDTVHVNDSTIHKPVINEGRS